MLPTKKPGVIATTLAAIFVLLEISARVVVIALIVLLTGTAFGWLLEYVTGDYVVTAFNALGANGMQDGDLPKVFGLLALIVYVLRIGLYNGMTRTKEDE